MKTIIYAHPWEGSFNHAILNTVTEQLNRNNTTYQVIDLYKESFDPTFSSAELQQYALGETPYVKVKAYQKLIQDSTELIFVFPIWWFDLPAILKGFLDKVMLPKFAYSEDNNNWQGLLSNIKKTTVITTAVMTKDELAQNGNAIQNVFINSTLNSIGISKKNTQWHHLGKIKSVSDETRKEFLVKIAEK